jgi:predicted dehydrogenase
MINIGIIGLGFMGSMHLNNYLKNDKSRVVAVCDLDESRASGEKNISGNIDIDRDEKIDFSRFKQYRDISDIVSDKDIDVIDICLPTDITADTAIKAMEAGKNVLCEKPMALTLEEGSRMIKTAREKKVILMIAHCIRFWPEYIYLTQVIKNKDLGKLNSLFLSRLVSHSSYSYDNWLLDEKKSKGAILNLHIHDVDYLVSLFGKPKSLMAQGFYEKDKGYSHVVAQFNYDQVPVVTAVGGWMMPATFEFKMGYTAIFEECTLIYDSSANPTLIKLTDEEELTIEGLPSGDGYSREIDYFLECILKGNEPGLCTPESTLESLEVVHEEINSILKLK